MTIAELATSTEREWRAYLWHHRRPWTRRLHFIGSCACLVGAGLAMGRGEWWWTMVGIAVGYLLAFVGHWVVEGNRPLTFSRPVFAAVCNWIMFALEISGRLDRHLARLESDPDRDGWEEIDFGSS